jgi:hypothetical protein
MGRSPAALNLHFLLGGGVNLCMLHIDCSISIQICLKSVYLHLIAQGIYNIYLCMCIISVHHSLIFKLESVAVNKRKELMVTN